LLNKISWQSTVRNVVSKSSPEEQDSVRGVIVHFPMGCALMMRRRPNWMPRMSGHGVRSLRENPFSAAMAALGGTLGVVTAEVIVEAASRIAMTGIVNLNLALNNCRFWPGFARYNQSKQWNLRNLKNPSAFILRSC